MRDYPIYGIKTFRNTVDVKGLYVNTFRNHLINHSFIESSHRHDFYLLVLFTKGKGIHRIDFNTFDIQKGSLYVIKPGQVHSWKLSDDIDGYIIFHTQELYNLYFGSKKIEDYTFFGTDHDISEINLNENELNEIVGYFELLVKETRNSSSRKQDKLLNIIDTIYIEIARKYLLENNHSSDSYGIQMQQFNTLLNQFYRCEKYPSFYAAKMNITLKHLNRICKNELNKTVTDLIAQKIVLESKRILTFTQKTVSETAEELGYVNYSYYTKLFKKYTGTTPSKFRARLKLEEW